MFFQHFQPILSSLILRSFDIFQLHSLVFLCIFFSLPRLTKISLFVHFDCFTSWRCTKCAKKCHRVGICGVQPNQGKKLRRPLPTPHFSQMHKGTASPALWPQQSKNQAMSENVWNHSCIFVSLSKFPPDLWFCDPPSHTEPYWAILSPKPCEHLAWRLSRHFHLGLFGGSNCWEVKKQSSKRSTDFVCSENHEWFWMIMRFLIKIWTSNSQFQNLEKTQLDNIWQ